MVKYSPRVVRFSLDLDVEQKNFLRLYAAKNELSASIVLRAMIYILETDVEFNQRVLDLIFMAPEVEVDDPEARGPHWCIIPTTWALGSPGLVLPPASGILPTRRRPRVRRFEVEGLEAGPRVLER